MPTPEAAGPPSLATVADLLSQIRDEILGLREDFSSMINMAGDSEEVEEEDPESPTGSHASEHGEGEDGEDGEHEGGDVEEESPESPTGS